jgi:hypothetical protein
MKDNFNLKKFLIENKTIEKLNPYFKKETLNEGNIRKKIREIILNELSPNIKDEEYSYLDYDEIEDKGDDESLAARLGLEDTDDILIDKPLDEAPKEKEEAKEDEPEEDVETEETEEDVETEEDADINSEDGLENVAADMEGDEGDLMNNLMGALKIAKGMNNEKLATQIGNTLKFFVSEYISDKE